MGTDSYRNYVTGLSAEAKLKSLINRNKK